MGSPSRVLNCHRRSVCR